MHNNSNSNILQNDHNKSINYGRIINEALEEDNLTLAA